MGKRKSRRLRLRLFGRSLAPIFVFARLYPLVWRGQRVGLYDPLITYLLGGDAPLGDKAADVARVFFVKLAPLGD